MAKHFFCHNSLFCVLNFADKQGLILIKYSRGVKLAAQEIILKLLMNLGSIATDRRRKNFWSPDHRPHLRGTNFCHSEINLLMLERRRPFFFGDQSYFGLHYRDRCPEKWWFPNPKLHAALGTIAHICNVAPKSPRVWHPWNTVHVKTVWDMK